MERPRSQTESILAIRANLLELIAVAVCIALGVNLLAGEMVLMFDQWRVAIGSLGICLIFAGCVFLVVRTAPRINDSFTFEGVLPVVGDAHEVIAIDRYEFAEETAKHVSALTAENKALARVWKENPLQCFDIDGDGQMVPIDSPAVRLTREALEYFVLDQLSLHLSDYFQNNPLIDDAEVTTIGSRDIPSVLLDNHFLELFSKPMEERDAFSTKNRSGINGGEVISASGKGGEIFDRFELILPRGTAVSRVNPETIRIETQRFLIQIKIVFDGFMSVLPRRFEEIYIGRDFMEVVPYHVAIEIDVKFKLRSLFSYTGWEYFRWLDSFIEHIEKKFSFERFLQDIGWSTAVSVAMVTERQIQDTDGANVTKRRAKKTKGEAKGKKRWVKSGAELDIVKITEKN